MALIVNAGLWLLLAVGAVIGIYRIVDAYRVKMRELEQRDLRAARRHSKPA